MINETGQKNAYWFFVMYSMGVISPTFTTLQRAEGAGELKYIN